MANIKAFDVNEVAKIYTQSILDVPEFQIELQNVRREILESAQYCDLSATVEFDVAYEADMVGYLSSNGFFVENLNQVCTGSNGIVYTTYKVSGWGFTQPNDESLEQNYSELIVEGQEEDVDQIHIGNDLFGNEIYAPRKGEY